MKEHLRIFQEFATWPVTLLDRKHPADGCKKGPNGCTSLLDRRRLKDKVVIVTGKLVLPFSARLRIDINSR